MKKLNIAIGRFQPFTQGHLNMVNEGEAPCIVYRINSSNKTIERKKKGIKIASKSWTDESVNTVIDYIDNPIGDLTEQEKELLKRPFTNELVNKELEIVKKSNKNILDVVPVTHVYDALGRYNAFLTEHSDEYEVGDWMCGDDRKADFENNIEKMSKYNELETEFKSGKTYPNILIGKLKINTGKGRTDGVSGTAVRKAILNKDKAAFEKIMPKGAGAIFNDFTKAFDDFKAQLQNIIKEHKMMSLKEYINENLNKYIQQHIYEVSDELLKRAIDKCYAQNTVLMRRRAKEFEKYLNDPERIKREELSGNSKVKQQFIKAYDENIIKAYELYDSGKKKESLSYFNGFGSALGKIINVFSTNKITVETSGKFHTFEKSCLKGGGYYLDPSPGIIFTKKRSGELFEYDGAALKIYFTLNADEEKLISHDYRKRIEARLIIQFYKKENRKSQGEYSTYFEMPWHCIPPEFEDEFKSIYQKISDLREINNDENKYKRYIGEDRLERHLPGWELLNNTFYANIDDHSVKDVIERMADVLKENDPKCKVEFKDESETSHSTNVYYGTSNIRGTKSNITAILTYNGVDYEVSGESDSSGWGGYGKISVNGEAIFGASKERYDDACWVGGRYKAYDALKNFFKD